jgi:hypothetical protein
LLPPTAGVDQLHRSSCIFVRHLLSFSSSPIPYLLRSGLSSGAPPAPVPTMPGGPPVAAPPPPSSLSPLSASSTVRFTLSNASPPPLLRLLLCALVNRAIPCGSTPEAEEKIL